MTDLVPFQSNGGRQVDVFEPQKAKVRIAKADAVIEYAATIKDWPLLERAVEEKIGQQAEFVEWWREHVRGKGKDANSADRGYFQQQAEELTSISHQQVSRWAKRLKDPEKYAELLISVEYKAAMGATDANAFASRWQGDQEGYTPAQYIEAARRAMGSIDVDPASCAQAQKIIKAAVYYDATSNGLAQEWRGTVFLNPPYQQPTVQHFIDKLLAELAAGRATQAVLLTNNNTDTRWFHAAAAQAQVICFTRGRIQFYKPDESTTQPTNGQSFFYFGEAVGDFSREFLPFGLNLYRS